MPLYLLLNKTKFLYLALNNLDTTYLVQTNPSSCSILGKEVLPNKFHSGK